MATAYPEGYLNTRALHHITPNLASLDVASDYKEPNTVEVVNKKGFAH